MQTPVCILGCAALAHVSPFIGIPTSGPWLQLRHGHLAGVADPMPLKACIILEPTVLGQLDGWKWPGDVGIWGGKGWNPTVMEGGTKFSLPK